MALSNVHFTHIVFIVMFLNFDSYPVVGNDSVWSAWSGCETPCPWKWCRNTICIGARTRSKPCGNGDGRNCTGAYQENVFCLLSDCLVKEEWSDWTSWSACSVTCGTGYRQRIRFCSDRESTCRGRNHEKGFCDAELVCLDEGFLGQWSEWSACSNPCGGIRKRHRTCVEPLLSGKNCSGNLEETGHCSENNCEVQSQNVRLVGGQSAKEGRVEVFYNRKWGTVCDDNFDDKDAAVVCSMLGFRRTNATAKKSAFFGEGTGQIWMDELRCTDTDTDLFQCRQSVLGSHNCGHGEDAGVVCQMTAPNIRLAGGSNAMEGRVEIFYNNEWGTVCDDSWTNTDAGVACFMLGYSRKNAIAKTEAYFGQGNSQMEIWMDDVNCQGDEIDLFHCNRTATGSHNCQHSEDAGVVCSLDGAVRLVGGASSLEGRVELYHDGSWGTICDDSWDNLDAMVICSTLGFSRKNAIARSGGHFPKGVGTIMLDDVSCIGTETAISECQHSGWKRHNCQHSEDAGVSCQPNQGKVSSCGAADILIIMDDSGSVGTNNFNDMKSFVKDVIRGLNSQLFRFSLITFSGTVDKAVGFSDYLAVSDILSAVDGIRYRAGGSTMTGAALRFARQSIFNVKRPDAANIVILFTDGQSTNSDETKRQAAELRSREVRIFAIGVGSGPNIEELNAIASSPSDEHVFQVSSFTVLSRIQSAVQNRTCQASVDGGFSEWSTWTACNRTCGTGTKSRSRTCTNPVPAYNGRNCSGSYRELVSCTIAGCPVDGQWSGWTPWIDCSVSCGDGHQRRSRGCTNPRPENGGTFCSGASTETLTCNSGSCPIHGGFSSWSDWNTCSKSCGLGTKSRSRSCTNPAPRYNGRNCTGAYTDTENCLTTLCPVDGGWSLWSIWTQCSVSCGRGRQRRIRRCDNPSPRYGGELCSGSNQEEIDCNANSCPIDGGFTQWSDWSACSKTCSLGERTRSRTCTNPLPKYNGSNCSGVRKESEDCMIKLCPVDGGWSVWNSWTSCNTSCGGGLRERDRVCNNPRPRNAGRPCVGGGKQSMDCNTNPCPIHGGFSEWSNWSSCSQTCSLGERIRSRTCTNPLPKYNGSNCTGPEKETKDCMIKLCPVHGGWSEWNSWTYCNASCGGGRRERDRVCNNPRPRNGGRPCVGRNKQSMNCNTNPCPIHGGFSLWGTWSLCSRKCNGGERTRKRNCESPAPAFGGSNCSGVWKESQTCNDHHCPVDGGFNDWTQWTDCSVTCGQGKKQRYRYCNNPVPRYGGKQCYGDVILEDDCMVRHCPINGGFSDWNSWSPCSKSCGGGLKLRRRNCDDPTPLYGGLNCSGNFVQSSVCKTNPCPIDGQFGAWEGWSLCSKSCGKGTQNRVRQCNSPYPRYGGRNCTENFSETKNCNTQNCPIDGGFSDWISWTDCSVSCGGGKKNRTRFCDSPIPSYGGKNCSGKFSEETLCKTFSCPIDGYFDEWEAWSPCSHSCGGGIQTRERICFDPKHGGRACTGHFIESLNCNVNRCPIDGAFSEWNTWTSCTKTCGGGTKKRFRQCDNPIPMYGGKNCSGSDTEEDDCNKNPCPIDGNYADWSEWTDCSKTCGSGKQYRKRTCSNPFPEYGGKDCVGKSMESEICNEFPCPINGRFSSWGDWDSCTVTCGGGTSKRVRECNSPLPQYGGSNCSGKFEEFISCMENPCPINGGFSDWSIWSSCSKSCGTGQKTRERSCNNPTPRFGGENCTGLFEVLTECNSQPCPIHGVFGEWQPWISCPVSCGGGIKNRVRLCDSPAPSYGGRDCIGNSTDEMTCNEISCPVDGGFAEWNGWSQCTRSCGGGIQTRNRTCDNPRPQHGGKPCIGHFIDYLNCNIQICPIDGGFSEWGLWSPCSLSCGGGSSKRQRSCTNPVPRYGGENCSETFIQTKRCQTRPCPIDGGFGEWGLWSPCSASCAYGSKRRERQCDKPSPRYNGKNCTGMFDEKKSCYFGPCPINGGFSSWEIWGDCSTTCGGGRKTRKRKCDNPIPAFGGSNCSSPFSEVQNCNSFPCPIDGKFSDWSDWSTCSSSCGGGSKSRSRSCSNPSPRYGGKPCTGLNIEYSVCNIRPCPIDGGFSEWGLWTTCTVTCGGGLSTRGRTCANPSPLYGGKNCSGLYYGSKLCNEYPCPIDGGFSEWSLWSACSLSCGGGLRTRNRECSNPFPQHGGRNCTDKYDETENCNTLPCPVDGGFGNWKSWSVCSRSCGKGIKRRERHCDSPPPRHGGKNCDGNFSTTLPCNDFPCPINGGFSDWSVWSQCSQSCGGGVKTRLRTCNNPLPQHGGKPCNGHFTESLNCNYHHCPIDGGFSVWSIWSTCSVTCGGGSSKRSRSCSNPSPLYGGKNCDGDREEFLSCNTHHCPIDGKYGDWSSWSECSVSCGGGSRARSRRCNNPSPQYGGKQCSGNSEENSPCNNHSCPIDGAFGEWETWSACSHSCGGGNKSRSRLCNNPAPEFGGKNCSGLFHESSNCKTFPCPIDGGIGSWSEWTLCSVSCGGGIQLRNRSCDNPIPKFGGKACDDEMSDSQVCNTNECPVDGKYTEWGAWTTCSVTCGGGKSTRNRTCTNPPPQFGGKTCSGDAEENKTCNSFECPIDGMYSEWGSWSECSVTCGGGTALRERDCSNPAPQYGGRQCEGPSNETKPCNTDSCSICESPSEQFECHDKAFCVPNSYKCDGIADCDDGSDEKAETCNSGPSVVLPCPEGLYRCPDGTCKYSQYDC